MTLCYLLAVKLTVEGVEYTATITDTDSTSVESRVVAYNRADAIILCFSLIDKATFKNIKTKWLKELEQHCSNTPIILVGTHSDSVHSPNIKKKNIVTVQQIEELLNDRRIIHTYCESSALTKEGLCNVFEEAFDAAWIGPVRLVMRMKTVHQTTMDKVKQYLVPCFFQKHKN